MCDQVNLFDGDSITVIVGNFRWSDEKVLMWKDKLDECTLVTRRSSLFLKGHKGGKNFANYYPLSLPAFTLNNAT